MQTSQQLQNPPLPFSWFGPVQSAGISGQWIPLQIFLVQTIFDSANVKAKKLHKQTKIAENFTPETMIVVAN